jgi:hypothetical protein
MARHEPDTILHGAPGVPAIIVRDHGAWEARVAAREAADLEAAERRLAEPAGEEAGDDRA